MNRYSIIVAAGAGNRFGSDIPKQFALLNGRPLLMHTLEKFAITGGDIIVVLPEAFIDYWKEQCNKFIFPVIHRIVPGGETRTQSVRNALTGIKDNSLITIHDGVRPLVGRSLIEKIFLIADEKQNAVPVIPVDSSMRKGDGGKNYSINRDEFMMVQTPQCFISSILHETYQKATANNFTDDATIVEAMGYPIHLIEGEITNIKITRPADLIVAEALLRSGILPS